MLDLVGPCWPVSAPCRTMLCKSRLDHGTFLILLLHQQWLLPRYCALICSPSSNDAQCGTNASCKSIQGTGLCTYDDDVDTNKATTVKFDATANGHYEDPKDGCGSDEIDITVQGIQGAVCAPKCTSGSCPTDLPAGVTAAPQCALQDSSSGDKSELGVPFDDVFWPISRLKSWGVGLILRTHLLFPSRSNVFWKTLCSQGLKLATMKLRPVENTIIRGFAKFGPWLAIQCHC